MNTTIAATIATQFSNDGMVFTDQDGNDFDEVCAAHGAIKERGRVWYNENGVMEADYDPTGDMIRYQFADGSALVISGDAWDIEGATLFSWESA